MTTESAVTSRPRLRPRWELLFVAGLLVAIYWLRQTGGLVSGLNLNVVDSVLILAIVVLSFRTTGTSRRALVIHTGIAVATIPLAVVAAVTESKPMFYLTSAAGVYLVGASAAVVFVFVLRERHVSGNTLFGALSVYLAVGVMFGIVFTVMAVVRPTAFSPPEAVGTEGETAMYYFSFVTLTTLGFGDIAPASDASRVLSTLEAMLGLVLLAALVGRIVGLMAGRQSFEDTSKQMESIEETVTRIERQLSG